MKKKKSDEERKKKKSAEEEDEVNGTFSISQMGILVIKKRGFYQKNNFKWPLHQTWNFS